MTLDAQSPYAIAQRLALKNMLRARRAQDTLVCAYCDNPSDTTEARLNAARDRAESCLSEFRYIDARHCEWIEHHISLMRAR